MREQGHEIGAHSVHHRYPFLDTDPKLEAEASKRWIEDRLRVEVWSYCYPFYHVTPPIKNAVITAGYKQARGGHVNSYYAPQSSIDWFDVDCRQISMKSENVEEWVRSDSWHVLTFHGIGTEQDGWEPISESEFARQMAELAKLRDAGAVEVVTFHGGAEHLRKAKQPVLEAVCGSANNPAQFTRRLIRFRSFVSFGALSPVTFFSSPGEVNSSRSSEPYAPAAPPRRRDWQQRSCISPFASASFDRLACWIRRCHRLFLPRIYGKVAASVTSSARSCCSFCF